MNWFRDNSHNIKSFFKILIPVLGIWVVMKFGPSLLRKIELINYTEPSIGIVSKIQEVEGIEESLQGSFVTINFTSVSYNYEVNDNIMKGNHNFQKSLLNLRERKYLSNLKIGDSVMVKYLEYKIARSIMELKK